MAYIYLRKTLKILYLKLFINRKQFLKNIHFKNILISEQFELQKTHTRIILYTCKSITSHCVLDAARRRGRVGGFALQPANVNKFVKRYLLFGIESRLLLIRACVCACIYVCTCASVRLSAFINRFTHIRFA